ALQCTSSRCSCLFVSRGLLAPVVCPCMKSLASSASPLSLRVPIGVLLVERMAVLAVCFCSISCASLLPCSNSQGIFATRHRLKVGRVDACPIAAEMVNLCAFWDRANKEQMGPPVGVGSSS